jgi:hypothetical protein
LWGVLCVFSLSALCVFFLWLAAGLRDEPWLMLVIGLLVLVVYLRSIGGESGLPIQLPGGGAIAPFGAASPGAGISPGWASAWHRFFRRSSDAASSAGRKAGTGAAGASLEAVTGFLSLFTRTLARGWRSGKRGTGTSSRQTQTPSREIPGQRRSSPSPWRKLSDAITQALLLSRFGGSLTRRQREYVARMLEMFERGQWDEALRHAIPLGKGSDGPGAPLSLGAPTARDSLEINASRAQPGHSMALGGLDEHLRQIYRNAFERLKEAKRFKEAAYVLAELLGADMEAVSFLEEHGEKRLAAEMAEARGLSPGLVVRQWFKAGDRERAVRFARLHGAFEDAILRLERTNYLEEAKALKLLWANELAKGGDFENAYLQSRGIEAAAHLAREWLERGIAAGGLSGARLMAHQLRLPEITWDQVRSQVLDLMDDEGAEAAHARYEFGVLLHNDPGVNGTLAARAAARACFRDVQEGLLPPDKLTTMLIRRGDDAALRADMPQVQRLKEAFTDETCRAEIVCAASDRGTLPVHDVAPLPDGSCLVALGEAGVRWLGRDGRIKAHFDQPAHALIPSHTGGSAILVARRGEAVRLARLNLSSRRAAFWHETILGPWANAYDGSFWFVAMGGRIVALDTQAEEFGKLWDSGELPGPVARLHWNPCAPPGAEWTPGKQAWITALVQVLEPRNAPRLGPDEPLRHELWQISQPELLLRARPTFRLAPSEVTRNSLTLRELRSVNDEYPFASLVLGTVEESDDDLGLALYIKLGGKEMRLDPEVTAGKIVSITAPFSRWSALTVAFPYGVVCYVADSVHETVRVRIQLDGATDCHTRFSRDTVILADDCGRVLTFDLKTGCVARQWRVR